MYNHPKMKHFINKIQDCEDKNYIFKIICYAIAFVFVNLFYAYGIIDFSLNRHYNYLGYTTLTRFSSIIVISIMTLFLFSCVIVAVLFIEYVNKCNNEDYSPSNDMMSLAGTFFLNIISTTLLEMTGMFTFNRVFSNTKLLSLTELYLFILIILIPVDYLINLFLLYHKLQFRIGLSRLLLITGGCYGLTFIFINV